MMVYIGVATKTAVAHFDVSNTLERVKHEAAQLGIGVIHKIEPRGDVCIGRAFLIQDFRDHPLRPDYFLSLDDDVSGYRGEDLHRCITSCEDFIGGVVPGRGFEPDVLAQAVRQGVPPNELGGYLSPMLVRLLEGELKLYKGHLLPVDFASLGWALLSRTAIERMIDALPPQEQACRWGSFTYPRLFRFTETPEGEALDDSSYLARHWREKCGGTVYVDVAMRLYHHGLHAFQSAPILERLRLAFGNERHPREESPPTPREGHGRAGE